MPVSNRRRTTGSHLHDEAMDSALGTHTTSSAPVVGFYRLDLCVHCLIKVYCTCRRRSWRDRTFRCQVDVIVFDADRDVPAQHNFDASKLAGSEATGIVLPENISCVARRRGSADAVRSKERVGAYTRAACCEFPRYDCSLHWRMQSLQLILGLPKHKCRH